MNIAVRNFQIIFFAPLTPFLMWRHFRWSACRLRWGLRELRWGLKKLIWGLGKPIWGLGKLIRSLGELIRGLGKFIWGLGGGGASGDLAGASETHLPSEPLKV